MDKDELRSELKKRLLNQKQMAIEMKVDQYYLNKFLHGFDSVGDKFVKKGYDWLSKQKETA